MIYAGLRFAIKLICSSPLKCKLNYVIGFVIQIIYPAPYNKIERIMKYI